MKWDKTSLHLACLARIQQTIDLATQAMEDIQQAANQETKSSVGDKYETGRAMMQQEKDKYALQLAQALELRQQLEQLDPRRQTEQVERGSLIQTNEGYFYLAISLGKITVEGQPVFVLSAASPLGQALLHKRVGEQLVFQGRKIELLALVND